MVDRGPVTRTRPPAWYPDPRDPARLRRWDGRAWTADTRPFPSWLRTLKLAPGPSHRHPSTNRTVRRLWISSVACLVLALVLLDLLGGGSTVVERISDRRFTAAANDACSRTESLDIEPNSQPLRGDAEINRVRRLVEAQERLVDELRDLPVAAADQDTVDGWLAAWDAWTAAGHRYAQASAAGDEAQARAVSERSRGAKLHIDAFASANGMPHCVQFRQS